MLEKRNTQDLVEQWMQQEREGVQFPVPFDEAWVMAGYENRKEALPHLRGCKCLHLDEDYIVRKPMFSNGKRGRPCDLIFLTTSCLDSFRMMANTKLGHDYRTQLIDAEKNLGKVDPFHMPFEIWLKGKQDLSVVE